MTFIVRRSSSPSATQRSGIAGASRAMLAAAAIVGLGGGAFALPAVQSSPSADELSRTPYQAMLSATCSGNGCTLDSTLVQANRRLEIHHLSCDFRINNPNTYLSVRTGVAAANNTLTANLGFHSVEKQPYGSGTMFTVSEPVFMFVPSGRKLRIMAISGGGSLQSFGCAISGALVRLKS